MPNLNSMHCTIEASPMNTPLRESGLKYGNQRVDCDVLVPDDDVDFAIRFSASNYCPPGLAIFVFIDGQYHSNRNCTGSEPHIDFRLRQKEEPGIDGRTLIGRSWRFTGLKLDWSDPPHIDKILLDNLGTIEVIVRRCTAADKHEHQFATDVSNLACPSEGEGVYADYWHIASDSWSYSPPLKPLSPKYTPDIGQHSHLHGWGIQELGEVKDYGEYQKQRHSTTHDVDVLDADQKGRTVKPYWRDWNMPKRGYSADPAHPRDPYIKPAYVQPIIYGGFARERGLNAQVVTGKGALYSHPFASPRYLDSMSSPFAVFTFHYRRGDRTADWVQRSEGGVVPDDSHKSQKQYDDGQESQKQRFDGNWAQEQRYNGNWPQEQQAGVQKGKTSSQRSGADPGDPWQSASEIQRQEQQAGMQKGKIASQRSMACSKARSNKSKNSTAQQPQTPEAQNTRAAQDQNGSKGEKAATEKCW